MEQATGQRASKRFSPAVEKRAKKDVTGGVTHGKDFLSSLLTSTLIEMCFLVFFATCAQHRGNVAISNLRKLYECSKGSRGHRQCGVRSALG